MASPVFDVNSIQTLDFPNLFRTLVTIDTDGHPILRASANVIGGGDATAANQNTGNASLASIDSKLGTEGSNSDGEAVKVSGVTSTESYTKLFNGTTWDRAYGSITFGGRSDIRGVNGVSITLGQKAMSASFPCVLASDQASIPVNGAINSGSAHGTVAPVMVGASDGTNATTLRASTSTTNGGTGIMGLTTRPFSMTDGTNVMPTMDAAARKGFFQITDGTNSAAVLAALLALKTDLSSVAGTAAVTGGLAGTLAVGGAAAHSAATTTNPVTVGGRVVPTTIATIDLTLAAGDASHAPITTGYQSINKPYGTAELDWASVLNFTPTVWASAATLTQVRAASGTANVRTYVTSLEVETDALGGAASLWLLDGPVSVTSATVATPGVFTNSGTNDFKAGDMVVFQGISGLTITGVAANQPVYVLSGSLAATTFTVALTPGGTGVQVTVTGTATVYRVLKQIRLQTTALPMTQIQFPTPIRTAPNVQLSAIASATQTGMVYVNAQGYYGF